MPGGVGLGAWGIGLLLTCLGGLGPSHACGGQARGAGSGRGSRGSYEMGVMESCQQLPCHAQPRIIPYHPAPATHHHVSPRTSPLLPPAPCPHSMTAGSMAPWPFQPQPPPPPSVPLLDDCRQHSPQALPALCAGEEHPSGVHVKALHQLLDHLLGLYAAQQAGGARQLMRIGGGGR